MRLCSSCRRVSLGYDISRTPCEGRPEQESLPSMTGSQWSPLDDPIGSLQLNSPLPSSNCVLQRRRLP